MAAFTTNYGFDVPTSSDLVKNGATQIALLGQDLDTFLFRPFTRNGALNSQFNVWQRGTSISYNNQTQYSADRWNASFAQTAASISRQVTGDTTNLPFIQYCARVQRTSGNTQTNEMQFAQSFETMNSIPYAGKTVTFSFYARKGANYSTAADALQYRLVTGTGTDQSVLSGFTGANNAILGTATLTATWQRFTASVALGATTTQIGINFVNNPAGTASTNDYYEVTGVMLEVGSQNSPYTPATPTYATELAACQRYYFASSTAIIWGGNVTSGSTYYVTYPWKTTMRVNPTVVTTSGGASGFASGAPSGADVKTNEGWFSNVANATASGSYFQFSLTASAEL